MLAAFISDNRDEIIRRCQAKVDLRSTPTTVPGVRKYGVPRFLDELIGALRTQNSSDVDIQASATHHGRDLHQQGFTVSQVVHDYGDVCQSITDLAMELNAPIRVEDFRTMNGCLDDAIASAVTEFGRNDEALAAAESIRDVEHLGFLAHEVRNLVGTASIAFEVLRTGDVGVGGSTGGVLGRSLAALRALINRSVENVRARHGVRDLSLFELDHFMTELADGAMLEAGARGVTFLVAGGAPSARIHGDRPVLTAVVMNLVQNGCKFTRPRSCVTLRGSATADRVFITIEDECGGLPDGAVEDLFRPFEQRNTDRTGLGLGLAMCRWGAEVNGGSVSVRNIPGRGCAFTLELPRH